MLWRTLPENSKIHAPHDAILQVAPQEADEACSNLRRTEAKAEDTFL